MRFFAIALAAALLPATASAQSAADPVERIMAVAKARWEGADRPAGHYFENLERDFSRRFTAVYREAQKYPVYDGSDYPFDYDVITSSQDGCPLKDVKVSPQGEKGGISVVAVSFKLWACASDAESQARVNELRFDVVMEDGVPVVSDIHRLTEGKWDTLVGEMHENIEYSKKADSE